MMRKRLVAMLVDDEGYRRFPYLCTARKLTIGIGRNLDDVGISKEEALYLLDNDINKVESELINKFPTYEKLDESRQIVLLNMAINMGVPRLLGFKRMLAAVTAKDYASAAKEMKDSLWATQVPNRTARLVKLMKGG